MGFLLRDKKSGGLGRFFLLPGICGLSCACLIFFAGCVSVIPVDEYSIARSAIEGAQEAEAARYAPALWYKAEQAYREGQSFFKNRDYDTALKRFSQARVWAEQAENSARLARFEAGDLGP